MLFGGESGNNSNNNKFNVNTKGVQFYNKDCKFPSTLVFGFWNENISLKIHPALPADKRTQSSVYDYNQYVSTSINGAKALELYNAIQDVIIPAIKEGKIINRGIEIGGMGGTGLVTIGSGFDGTINPYIAIFKNLDANTRKPSEFIFYQFNSMRVISNYSHESGEFQPEVNPISELQLFATMLKAATEALTNAETHAGRNVNRAYKDKLMNATLAIANKLGASVESYGSFNKGGGSVFDNNRSGSNKVDDVPFGGSEGASVETMSDMGQLNDFMN